MNLKWVGAVWVVLAISACLPKKDAISDATASTSHALISNADSGIVNRGHNTDWDFYSKISFKAKANESQISFSVDGKAAVAVSQNGKWKVLEGSGPWKIQTSTTKETQLSIKALQFAGAKWNGELTIKIVSGSDSDKQLLKVEPWLMLPTSLPVQTVFVRKTGMANPSFGAGEKNKKFRTELIKILNEMGIKTVVAEHTGNGGLWQEDWMQDTMEVGATGDLSRAGVSHFVMKAMRGSSNGKDVDRYVESQEVIDQNLIPFGFVKGAPDVQAGAGDWSDWLGNLEVTTPLPNYPFGRVLYGSRMHERVKAFLKAQKLQAPAVEFNVDWLDIGHIDEALSIVEFQGNAYAIVPSPDEAMKILKANTSEKSHINIDVSYNNARQNDITTKIENVVIKELGIPKERIIRMPALYNNSAKATSQLPNPVNSLYLGNGHVIVPKQHLPYKPFVFASIAKQIETNFAKVGLKVHFLDDEPYHVAHGNIHCATNVIRKSFVQSSLFTESLNALRKAGIGESIVFGQTYQNKTKAPNAFVLQQ